MRYCVYVAKPGLANRIRALSGYYALARSMQLELKVQWLPEPACDAPLQALIELPEVAGLQFISEPDDSHHSDPDCVGVYPISYNSAEIHRRFGQDYGDSAPFTATAVHLQRSLKPKLELRAQVDQLDGDWCLSAAIGIHFCMTDNLNTYRDWQANGFVPVKASRLEGLGTVIEETQAADQHFCIGTSNAQMQEAILLRQDCCQRAFAALHTHVAHNGEFSTCACVASKLRRGLFAGRHAPQASTARVRTTARHQHQDRHGRRLTAEPLRLLGGYKLDFVR